MTMIKGDMINLLFDKMINRLNKELPGLEVRDYEASNTHFRKAQAITSHLVSTLGHQYPVSQSLASLYECFDYQTPQANVKKSPEPVNEAPLMTMELKEASAQADKQVRMGHTR